MSGSLISIVVPTVSTNKSKIVALLRSLSVQTYRNFEVILVADKKDIAPSFPEVGLAVYTSSGGASMARNVGARASKGSVLAFLDDDVVLDRTWCEMAATTFVNPSVGAVSGKTLLAQTRFDYTPPALRWAIGATYWASGDTIDVVGAAGMNFCVSKKVFEDVGGYDETLGPTGEKPELLNWRRPGAEEIDLAIRIIESGHRVLYNPLMVATHLVGNQSLTPSSMMKRAMHVGHNRAIISRRNRRYVKMNNHLVLRNVSIGMARDLFHLAKNPFDTWRKFSFTMFILVGVAFGWVFGILDDSR